MAILSVTEPGIELVQRRTGKLELALSLCICTTLTGYSLVSFLPGLLQVESRSITIPLRGVILAFALFCLFLYRKRFRASRGLVIFLSFWTLYTIRLFVDTLWSPSTLWQAPDEYWLAAFGITVIPALIFCIPALEDNLPLIRVGLTLLWGLVSMFSLLFGNQDLDDSGRLAGNSALDPISTGHVGGFVVVLCLYYLIGKQKTTLRMLLAGSFLLIGLLTLLKASSRGPVLSVAVAVAVLLLANLVGKNRTTVFLIVIALALAVPYFVKKAEQDGASLVNRMDRISDNQALQEEARYLSYGLAWEAYLSSPVLGSGVDLPGGGYPHNVLLEVLMSTGTLGGILFFSLLFHSARQAWRLLRAGHPGGWFGLLFFQYCVGTLFSGNIYASQELWYFTLAVATLGAVLPAKPAPTA